MPKVIIFAAVLGVLAAAAVFGLIYVKTAQKMFSRKNKEIKK